MEAFVSAIVRNNWSLIELLRISIERELLRDKN